MADSATLAAQIADYDSHKVTSTDALNEALKQYGVPEIRQNVAGLRTTVANTTNALKSVDPSVTGRTSGSLVTEAQRQRQVVNERAPIAEQLSTFGGQLVDQEKTLTDNTNQATTMAGNRVRDYETGRQALQSQYDTTYKREQDAQAAEAQRQAADREQANQDRAYQLAVQSARTSSAKASAPNAAQSKQQDMATIAANLDSKKGKDNHVSQETWNKALSDWTHAGYSASEFVKQNIRYINQRYKGYSGFN